MSIRVSLYFFILTIFLIGCNKPKEQPISPQEKYISSNPDTPEDIKTAIREGTVKIGMTSEQVIASWGEPQKIDVFSSEENSYKRWIYNGNKPALYWKDGKVSKMDKK